MLNKISQNSYAWCGTQGDKVLVVIDDDCHYVGVSNPFPQGNPAAMGLYAIFKYRESVSGLRAVGYFSLPTDENEARNALIPAIKTWLGSVQGEYELFFLIDTFLGHPSDAIIVGPMVTRLVRDTWRSARVGALSQATVGAGDEVIREKFIQAAVHLNPDDIHSKYPIEEHARAYERLPDGLVRWFGQVPAVVVSDWSVGAYNKLRKVALRACNTIGAKDPGHGKWAHHLPYGGFQLWDPTRSDAYVTQLIKAFENEGYPELARIERFGWTHCAEKGLEPFQRPPLRALCQADRYGHDLSTALCLLVNTVSRELPVERGHRFSFDFGRGWCQPERLSVEWFRHDYLWFNVSSLSKGLLELARGFRDEAEKKDKPGLLFWRFREDLREDGNTLCFSVLVWEELLNWNACNPGEPSFSHEYRPLPLEVESQQHNLYRAYQHLRRSGAKVSQNEDAFIWTIRAAKQVVGHPEAELVHWEVEGE